MQKKILITGVAGFLGSYLARKLVKEENNLVIGIDNLCTGLLSNIKDIVNKNNFCFIQTDVSEKEIIKSKQLQGVHEIYHLASLASPKFYQAYPLRTIAVTTTGTQNMLELAKINNAKIVYSSTSEAYGDPEINPQSEKYWGNVNTWGPRACYDESKRLGEVFCYEYYQRYKIQVKVARIFNTYSAGLRNDDGRVISNFVTQAIKNENITVYGDGSQTRSFCYVDDTIRGLLLMMEKDQASGEIINIGNRQEYKIIDLAYLIKKLTFSSSQISFQPLPEDDPKVRRPVIDKAKELLGWEPIINLEEGLRETISVYREKMGLGKNGELKMEN
ncbi:MAG: NAD-dependent dehydratase [Peptococcaceae bacterium BICA1-8]|nr:MAG: NAD-dependent dehydratase [Peptococcaceae bacterium BICA1-8]